jgi:hypothetical protein
MLSITNNLLNMMKKSPQNFLIAGASALLFACGGGDNSPTTSTSPTDKYKGTWVSSCSPDSSITISGANSNSTGTYTIPASVNNAQFSGTFSIKTYATADVTCTGTVLSTIDFSFGTMIDSFGTGAGGSDKVTVSGQAGTINGNTFNTSGAVTINNITYAAGTFSATAAHKSLVLVTATTLQFGDGTETVTTYPTGLDTTADNIFTKK